MSRRTQFARYAGLLLALLIVWQPAGASGVAPQPHKSTTKSRASSAKSSVSRKAATHAAVHSSSSIRKSSSVTRSAAVVRSTTTHKPTTSHKYVGVPTFADSTKDDIAQFDDPIVRAAAVQ